MTSPEAVKLTHSLWYPEVECAIQLRRIGDKLNFRQKLVNLISKLLRSGT
ncbi:hypothetical protein FD755_009315 [Muntiacus reevesi]|uniref:Phorbol-12-myristate-13-acetate-induced protein 1 n=2 Tax=Muntiacus TaxID=9885 RepID=A0A5N3XWM9_MUNRE|nr:hypothetical protein FD754_000914 [Muntiacus muntjak]KAB0377737.1 hypothetical protein FD755_009315 [Muntiacus reevesi]